MRPEGSGSPLDLNNLPDDYMNGSRSEMGNQAAVVVVEDASTSAAGGGQVGVDGGGSGGVGGGGGGVGASSSGGGSGSGGSSSRKKKSGGGKDESGKVYECRFCSLKFCKSQALGGHMNRHRQERETEELNRARHLVYSNEAAYGAPPPPYMAPTGRYHPPHPHQGLYPTSRLFTGSGSSSSSILPTRPPPPSPPPPYLYTSPVAPTRLVPYPPTQQYPPGPHLPNHDYFVGHAVPGTSYTGQQQPGNLSFGGGGGGGGGSGYTCIGAPVGLIRPNNSNTGSDRGDQGIDGGGRGGGGGYVGTSSSSGHRQQMDSSSSINRYHHHQHHQDHHGSF